MLATIALSHMLAVILSEVLLLRSASHLLTVSVPGMLLSSQFPVNYFSISEVEQFFPAFADEYGQFERSLGGAGKFWRFNRLHDYANKVCQVSGLGSLLSTNSFHHSRVLRSICCNMAQQC